MAKIVGNLKPEDDYTHELGPEPNFNESMYFNFFDRENAIGGFVRLGNRANEGYAEMTVTLYLPDGRVLFSFKRPEIEHNDAFDAGGCRFEVLEPTERLRTTYKGSVVELAEPRQMTNPKRAFTENPKKRVDLDLIHEAAGPFYGQAKHRDQDELPSERQFGRAHYEQHMRIHGTLKIDEETFEIDGFGLRDHSWGPRHWQAIQSYDWLTMNFGPDFHAMVSIIQFDEEKERRWGVVVRGEEMDLIVDTEIEVDWEEDTLFHKAVRARAKTAKGEELHIEGRVQGFIPLRNRRGGHETHIGEGMTEWRCQDRVGYGLSELLRQVK